MIWNFGQLPENWTMEKLSKSKHPSIPFNPDIANAFFRCGYIETWGRGYSKMTTQCLSAGLPIPLYYYDMSGFWVVFRKDVINEEDLRDKILNERQIKAVLYVKEKGKITNKEYQELNNVISRTALRDLDDLIFKEIFKRNGEGKNVFYIISLS
ncbi:MAG: hypothetical protein LBQ31_07010 [Bacteroidales bacterium]|jgi:ATP-dependent DNA helicase RecG|nr:hypothetical protein [Bacteroidales bacterium]